MANNSRLRGASCPSGHAWRLMLIHERMRSAIEAEAGATRSLQTHRNPTEPLRSEPVDAAGQNGFIFVGRLSLEKGPDLACEAAKRAGVQITVVGEGEMRAALERRYPQVRFVGWKSRSEIGELFGSARALLVSSRAPEPYSLACVEALRCGLPVIIAESAYLAPELVALGCALSTNEFGRKVGAFRYDDPEDSPTGALRRKRGCKVLAHGWTPARREHCPNNSPRFRCATSSLRSEPGDIGVPGPLA